MTLRERREKAEAVAQQARELGFTSAGFLLRDSYRREVFTESKLEDLLSTYCPGDLVTIDILLDLGRGKAKVEAAS
jgi:hypothetical protein